MERTDTVRRLTHVPSSFAKWRSEISLLLRANDAWDIVTGVEVEPYRSDVVTREVEGGVEEEVAFRRSLRAGSLPPPSSDTPGRLALTSDELKKWGMWRKRENYAQALILRTVSDAIRLDIEEMLSALEMWQYCNQLHVNGIREVQREVKRKLTALDLRDDANAAEMAAHVASVSSLVYEAKLAELPMSEADRVDLLLNSLLAPSYRLIRAEFRLLGEEQSSWVNLLRLYNEETARRQARPPPRLAGTARAVNPGFVGVANGRGGGARGGFGGRGGAGGGSGGRNMSQVKCYSCGQLGHIARDCRKPGSGYQGQRGRGGAYQARQNGNYGRPNPSTNSNTVPVSKPEDRLMMSDLDAESQAWIGVTVDDEKADWYTSGDEDGLIVWPDELPDPWKSGESVVGLTGHVSHESLWVLDSGATHHITPNPALLINLRDLPVEKVFGLAGRHATMTAKQQGDAVFKLPNGGKLVLKDVFLVPDSRVSLLSLSCLTGRGWDADFRRGKVVCRGLELDLLKKGALWTLALEKQVDDVIAVAEGGERVIKAGMTPLYHEHCRLGHIGRERLLELAKEGKLVGRYDTHKLDPFTLADCDACASSKATRLPKSGNAPTLAGGEQGLCVEVDLAGPFTRSIDGKYYLFIGLERSSGVVCVEPIAEKSDGAIVVPLLVAKLERQLGSRVRVVRSDGGKEFGADDWFSHRGIIRYVTTPYTPELNGAAERMVRTVKAMVSSMMKSARWIDHRYWSYAAKYAGVVIMKTARKPISPWTALTGRREGIDSLLAFGQPVYAQIPRETRHKSSFLVDKARYGYVIGQTEGTSGYIVKVDGSIVLSRDVRTTKEVKRMEIMEKEWDEQDEDEWEKEVVVKVPTNDIVITEKEKDEALVRRVGPVVNKQPRRGEKEKEEEPDGEPSSLEDNAEQGEQAPVGQDAAQGQLEEEQAQEAMEPTLERGSGIYKRYETREVGLGEVEKALRAPEMLSGRTRSQNQAHLALLSVIYTLSPARDPRSLREALSSPERSEWLSAHRREWGTLESKGTFEHVRIPKGANVVAWTEVFKTKVDADGKVVKRKARLVARGDTQVYGVDFEFTFAATSRMESFRLIVALATVFDLWLWQGDVEAAYLNAKLEETVFMPYPEMVDRKEGCDGVRLIKSLYGLKQSARNWWLEVTEKLTKLGFERLAVDWGLYYRPAREKEGGVIVMVYVDDFIVAGPTKEACVALMRDLGRFWAVTDLGEAHTILGMKVTRDRKEKRLWLNQKGYIEKVVDRFGSRVKRRRLVPISTSSTLRKEGVPLTNIKPYQELIGCLQWLAQTTRPDIAFASSALARFLVEPTEEHWRIGVGVVDFLSSTRDLGIAFDGSRGIDLRVFVDADYAGCLETRRSTTGIVVKLAGGPVAWKSKRQETVSTSTVEAEYVAISEGAKLVVWVRNVMAGLGYSQQRPTTMYGDNQGAIALIDKPGTHARTKHIDVRHHLIRELVAANVVKLEYIGTKRQQADIMTKSLDGITHATNTWLLGMAKVGERSLAPVKVEQESERGYIGIAANCVADDNRLPTPVSKADLANRSSYLGEKVTGWCGMCRRMHIRGEWCEKMAERRKTGRVAGRVAKNKKLDLPDIDRGSASQRRTAEGDGSARKAKGRSRRDSELQEEKRRRGLGGVRQLTHHMPVVDDHTPRGASSSSHPAHFRAHGNSILEVDDKAELDLTRAAPVNRRSQHRVGVCGDNDINDGDKTRIGSEGRVRRTPPVPWRVNRRASASSDDHVININLATSRHSSLTININLDRDDHSTSSRMKQRGSVTGRGNKRNNERFERIETRVM